MLDVRTPDQLNLPRPNIVGSSPIIVSVPASEGLVNFVGELSQRSEKVRTREVHPSVDNMLKITSEGRKAALDMRLVKPALGEQPNNKIDALVERVGKIYGRTKANRGAQIIFCDLATPKGRGLTVRSNRTPRRTRQHSSGARSSKHLGITRKSKRLAKGADVKSCSFLLSFQQRLTDERTTPKRNRRT
jgi:methyl coenzyme M reductase subunit C-like uncharacterized protein (methanogenesis marker protein 7)